MIDIENVKRGLNKFSTKDLRHSDVLGNNFGDEVGVHGGKLRTVTKEINLAHMGVVINKNNVIVISRDRGSTRWTPYITMEKVKGTEKRMPS